VDGKGKIACKITIEYRKYIFSASGFTCWQFFYVRISFAKFENIPPF
jgi:hypothetical protein